MIHNYRWRLGAVRPRLGGEELAVKGAPVLRVTASGVVDPRERAEARVGGRRPMVRGLLRARSGRCHASPPRLNSCGAAEHASEAIASAEARLIEVDRLLRGLRAARGAYARRNGRRRVVHGAMRLGGPVGSVRIQGYVSRTTS